MSLSFAFTIPERVGHFLAGFAEGEGHLGISEINGGQSLSCFFSLGVRDDDSDLIEWMAALTGLGSVLRRPARANSRPQVVWRISSQADCVELVRIIDRFPFRGRKAAEFEIWRAAVHDWPSGDSDRAMRMRAARSALKNARLYVQPGTREACPPATAVGLAGYLAGLVAAEGCFELEARKARFTMKLRADDRPLLAMLQGRTGLGRLHGPYGRPDGSPALVWVINALDDIVALFEILSSVDLRGRKARDLAAWAHGVKELQFARDQGRPPHPGVMAHTRREVQLARAYRPREKRPLYSRPRRDMRSEAIQALELFASIHNGVISCTAYSKARRDHPSWPSRNTVTSTFGTWESALDAAGIRHRRARSTPRRRAVADSQRSRGESVSARRELVLSGVERFVQAYGHIPRAMEFFRWRLVDGLDLPSQATVYLLFPGGWDAVLAAYHSRSGSAEARDPARKHRIGTSGRAPSRIG